MSTRVLNFGLDEALVSDEPIQRVVARGTASTFSEHLAKWIESERERGTEPGLVLIALMDLSVMIHSSLAANFMRKGFGDIADGFKQMIDAKYVEHAELCVVSIAAARKKEGGR